ncbi:hypothetical protein [Candidatus Soleaferrea massiliensis]|uniref:hypothetical protein n=1 Tax=Candidatus Soleaferrea massiliensis TaxID=1470354 RepID=UPI00058AEAAD|nr:hypothetical protein [Candidatus Soleaferrea massiliensis]
MNRIKILLLLSMLCLTLSGCDDSLRSSGAFENSYTASESVQSVTPSISGSISDAAEPSGQLPSVSPEQMECIPAGQTYRKIMEQLDAKENRYFTNLQVLLLDQQKIIVLKYDDADEICLLSGKELLESAVLVPDTAGADAIRGVVIDDNIICCPNSPDSLYAILDISSQTDIVFQDGQPASRQDIKLGRSVCVTYDYTLASDPPRISCTSISIER